jgi:transcriptional regulator with XRE-family HTH domain
MVRTLRRTHGWTIEDAAERFGIEPAYVRSIETGRTNPSFAVIVSIAEAFEKRAGDLLLTEMHAVSRQGRGRSG